MGGKPRPLRRRARAVAFLRGMNLGRRRITNHELVDCFATLGFDDVQAFLASGNVIFAVHSDVADLERYIAEGLEEMLGYPVATFVRSAAEVRAIAARQPFGGDRGAAGGKPQVVMFPVAPPTAARQKILALASDDDRLELDGRELYWLPAAGLSSSELDLGTIERLAGPTTIRTKNTIDRIAARFLADSVPST